MTNLGFVDLPRAKRIYIGRVDSVNPALWYTWDSEADKAIPIVQPALKCILKSVDYTSVESDYGTHDKLKVLVQADQEYEIFCGVETWFSKTLLVALDSLNVTQLSNPLTIAIRSSDAKSKVYFATVFDFTGKQIYAEHTWKSETGELLPFDAQTYLASINDRLQIPYTTTDTKLIEAATIETQPTVSKAFNPNSLADLATADIPF